MRSIYPIGCWLIPGLALVYSALERGGTADFAGWVFLGSIGFMGLPHGGCDPWLPRWLGATTLSWIGATALYLALALATAGLWVYRPQWALTGFLAVTAWHWGTTDARGLGIRLSNLWGVGRGLLVVGAASGWQPHLTRALYESVAASGPLTEALLTHGPAVALLGIGMEIAALGLGRDPAWKFALAESALIAVVFRAAHPLLAISAYFIGIHSARSIEVTAHWLPQIFRKHRLAGFHLAALPGAAAVLLVLPWCASRVAPSPPGLERWVAAYFILLSILTPPHAILFALLPQRTAAHD